ncbi:hypothetical protein ZEAMMB73_Zm00001d015629 [Zea mays]|uniref:BTB domain-containing protein n=1 Tax=Zea mays TaxID=4577 RepID=A0A1D6H313_MAIZE|nr:hypothetical protein ZEAMMB73_Zm00001d015629 [Zea mays]
MPENGSLHKVAVEVECVAEAMDKDAHKVEAVNDKVCYALSMLLLEIEYFNMTCLPHIPSALLCHMTGHRPQLACATPVGVASYQIGPDQIEALYQFCTTGLPSDVTVEVGDVSFHLHKFLLLSKSAFLEWSIEENSDQEECIIKLNVIPGVPSHLS